MTTHIDAQPVYTTQVLKPSTLSLQELRDIILKRQVTPDKRLDQELALSRHIAAWGDKFRILCRGVYRGERLDYTAALVYNTETKSCEVWIPSGPNNGVEIVDIHNFHSTIPHAGIAREVFMENDSGNSTI